VPVADNSNKKAPMAIDVKTLFLVLTLVGFLLAFWVAVMAYGKPRTDPLWPWACALTCYSLADVVVSLRGGASMFAILPAVSIFYAGGIALMLVSLRRFQCAPLERWKIWVPIVLAPVLTTLALEISVAGRVYTAVLIHGTQIVFVVQALADRRYPIGGRGRWMLGGTFMVLLLMLAGRALVIGSGLLAPAVVVTDSPLQAVIFLLLIFGLLSMTLGFVYMTMERAERQSRELAMRDMLTGLANRRAITEDLEHVVARARRQGERFSLLMLDIDHFKRINDSFGHQAGDVVLRVVAEQMQLRLRAQDHIGRFGGEEFLIVLPDTDLGGAQTLAEALRAGVEAHPTPWGAHQIAATVSIGICASTGTVTDTADSLVAAADAALYRAKQNGRNRFAV